MFAHLIFQHHHITPRELVEMRMNDPKTYAFLLASMVVEAEDSKKRDKEMRSKTRARR